jgi:hypothetical protein
VRPYSRISNHIVELGNHRPSPFSVDGNPQFDKPLLNQSTLKSSGIDLLLPFIIVLIFVRLIIIYFLFHLIPYSLIIFFCLHLSSFSSSTSLIVLILLLPFFLCYSSFPLVPYYSSFLLSFVSIMPRIIPRSGTKKVEIIFLSFQILVMSPCLITILAYSVCTPPLNSL